MSTFMKPGGITDFTGAGMMTTHKVFFGLLIMAVLLIAAACSSEPETTDSEEMPVSRWPRTLEHEGYKILVYEPQLEAWTRFEKLEVRSALLLEREGDEHPIVGGMVWTADTDTNFDDRTVIARNIGVAEATFPSMDAERTEELRRVIEVAFPEESVPVPLDLILAHLEHKGMGVQPVEVNLEPPPIFVSQEPAILLQFMGEPRFEQVAETTLMIAVNASWDVFFSAEEATYYLRVDDSWLSAPDPFVKQWSPADALPAALQQLPGLDGWDDLASAIPGEPLDPAPRVFTASQPAELIVIEGLPEYSPIPGTSLMLVANTRSKLFFDSEATQFYFLTAGRWFRTASLQGVWQPATAELPDDFQRIPPDHASADVLSSVPGTRDAEEAMLAASIPLKAEVKRDSVKLEVPYDGEPQPVLIKDTTVYYMVNTTYDVFLVDGRYYACHEGIWFEAGGPNGPWLVADAVPAALYSIPPSSPKHNVTYVKVYDSTPDTVVVGYTSGYNGMYTAEGVVMLGLGIWLWDEMWDDHYSHYHHYHHHPHYYGYGGGAWYDPHSGHYRREAHAYGPYGSAHGAARYDPHTGAWARGGSVNTYHGSRGFAEGYNPRTDTYAATRQGSNPYASWGQGVVSRGDDWARTARYSDASGTKRAFETSEGTRGVTSRGPDGTAGVVRKDGDLYFGPLLRARRRGVQTKRGW